MGSLNGAEQYASDGRRLRFTIRTAAAYCPENAFASSYALTTRKEELIDFLVYIWFKVKNKFS